MFTSQYNRLFNPLTYIDYPIRQPFEVFSVIFVENIIYMSKVTLDLLNPVFVFGDITNKREAIISNLNKGEVDVIAAVLTGSVNPFTFQSITQEGKVVLPIDSTKLLFIVANNPERQVVFDVEVI